MLSSKVTGTLLGRKKLVALVALAFIGAAASYALATRSTAKADVLTAAGDAWVLVKLEAAKTWSAADAYCTAAYGTHLAVIEDSAANQAMSDALTHYSVPAWIGFADLQNEGDFEWVDASPEAYANWDEGEPTDLCVQMLSATGTWKDVDCAESLKAFFCEAPAAMTATAAVRLDNFEVHSLDAAIGSGEAQAYCQSQGGGLHSVIDAADNERIATALRAAEAEFAFIGLETAPQSYAWTDGRALDFEMWATDEPKQNQFSQMSASDGQWMTACFEDSLPAVVCEQMNYAPPITPPPAIEESAYLVYAHSLEFGAAAKSQCLASESLYGSNMIATAVRCIYDDGSEVGGFSQNRDNVCYPMGVDFAEAKSICEADGLRLPTTTEATMDLMDLSPDCAYDYFNVWTSDECQSSEEVPAFGYPGHYAYGVTLGAPICLLDVAKKNPSDALDTAIRCCAIDDANSCDSGEAECYGTWVTQDAANEKCASVGKELCNLYQVKHICPATECNYDNFYVRSTSVCFFHPL